MTCHSPPHPTHIQIAKLLGAKVVAVDLGPDKAAFLRSQGADVVVDASQASKERPLHKMIKAAAPQGANVVFDPVGGWPRGLGLNACWGCGAVNGHRVQGGRCRGVARASVSRSTTRCMAAATQACTGARWA